jgi:hypothetical protein
MMPAPVASSLPTVPPTLMGLPVTTAGVQRLCVAP